MTNNNAAAQSFSVEPYNASFVIVDAKGGLVSFLASVERADSLAAHMNAGGAYSTWA